MFLLLATLTGCTASQVEGVWMLLLDPAPDVECQDVVSHNFVNAQPLGDEGEDGINPWTEDSGDERSGSMLFAQITYGGDGDALMVLGGEALPGRQADSGAWIFDWEGNNSSYDRMSHTQGYSYSETSQATSTTLVTLTFDKDTAAGSIIESTTSLLTWTESDNWNDNLVGLGAGQIPASAWLEIVNPITDVISPAENAALSADCTNEPCSITVSNVCEVERAIAATRTGYSDEDAYDFLEGYGQAEGADRPDP